MSDRLSSQYSMTPVSTRRSTSSRLLVKISTYRLEFCARTQQPFSLPVKGLALPSGSSSWERIILQTGFALRTFATSR